jgi:hypothetical protein
MNLAIRITTALAVATVAAVAAVISYRHAYELVSTHGETGITARLLPFTVDDLILAPSVLILDANRRSQLVPPLARWCLGAGIAATIGANLAHGLGHAARVYRHQLKPVIAQGAEVMDDIFTQPADAKSA